MPSESCVSVRAMVRTSQRAIDPEFDSPRDTLVSFVDHDDGRGPSLLLAPVPLVPTRARSLSRGNNMAPMKRRHRSFGAGSAIMVGGPGSDYARKPSAGSSLHSSGNTAGDMGSVTSDGEDRMVDVSLEEGPEGHGRRGGEEGEDAEALNTSLGSAGDPLSLSHRPRSQSQPLLTADRLTADRLTASQHSRPAGLPVGPSGTGNAPGQKQRYASPFAVHRTTSGSSSIVSSTHSDTHLGGSVRSRTSSRSRSRSRSARRMGGHLRMRSLGAASAFAAASSQTGNGEDEMDNGEGETLEPLTIPLKEILSVDEEIPSRRKGSGSGGSRAGGSDFFSSAASDVDAAQKAVGDERAGATSALHPHPTSPPPSTSNGHGNGKVPHRIFLHTLGHGYVECSLDHANSHDVFLAYLKAHLAPDRVPDRTHPHTSGHHRHHVGGGLRTMVLTPTKEVPSALGSSSRTLTKGDDTDADTTTTGATPARSPARSVRSLSRPAIVSRSRTGDSTLDSTRDIDRLHSRAIKHRLKAEATPFRRFQERVAAAVSSMMDCACCQDTTVAPLEEERSKNNSLQTTGSSNQRRGSDSGGEEEDRVPSMKAPQQQQRSPTAQRLWGKGIGGLSFEESCASAPKLSFEKSMDRG